MWLLYLMFILLNCFGGMDGREEAKGATGDPGEGGGHSIQKWQVCGLNVDLF